MLRTLKIKNLATIEGLEVSFPPEFSILTGETGAGKSIIIDAIRLITGEKGSTDLIRTGAEEASIEAEFETSGLPFDSGDVPPGDRGRLLIQRTVNAQGGGRVYLNGVLVPVRRLKEIGGLLVDIYGQNDHIFLLHTENHRRFLDDLLEDQAPVRETARLAGEIRRMLEEHAELETREREREQRLDFLNFQLAEVERADLKPGEDQELYRQREIIKNAEKIAGLVEAALSVAYVDENSLVALTAKLRSLLADLSAYDRSVETLAPGVQEAAILFEDLAKVLLNLKDGLAEKPADPEAVEERLSVIEKLKRKYAPTVEGILEKMEEARQEKQRLETSSERLAELSVILNDKFSEYARAAASLSGSRKKTALKLEQAIEKHLSVLGMKKSRFKIKLQTRPPCLDMPETIRDSGAEEVEFLISTNPGEDLKPLRRVASGGELSRMMLALKSVGRERETCKTLIFDEIDSGIGGKTAEAIALKLRALAGRHQVLCITHLPQIAASAANHFHVEKTVDKDRTFTRIRALAPETRIAEIARLISGSHVTKAALETASQMLGLHGGKTV